MRVVISAICILTMPMGVMAQDLGAAEAKPASTVAPVEPASTGPLTYDQMLDRGHSLYLGGRYDEAIAQYDEARNERSDDPLTLYYAGCALMKLGRYDDALGIFERMRISTGATTPSSCARAMFMIAILAERRGDDAAAVKAWTEYKIFAEAHATTRSFLQTATERLRVYEAKSEMEAEYQVVRERIASSQE